MNQANKIIFDVHGNLKQLNAVQCWIDNSVSDIVFGGSKGAGKSFLGCSLICGNALIYPETFYFIARKKLNDLRKFTIPSINEVLNLWGISKDYYKYNGQDSVFEFQNGSKIFLLDAKYLPSDPSYARFGSMQMTRGWIEEAGEFEVEAKNNLMASVGRWNNEKYNLNGKVLQTCNPAKNYLYKDYYQKNKAGTLEAHKRFIQALPTDNKKIDAGYLDHLNNVLSPNEKQRLLFGNWEFDDDPTVLCDYENITAIFTNDHVKKTGKKSITCDVARFGSDKAVILVWDGWVIIDCYTYDKSAINDLSKFIQALRFKHGIAKKDVIIDADGVGGGLVDFTGGQEFTNNSKALNEENYFNLQSQCCYYLAKMVNENQIYFAAEISEQTKDDIIEEIEQGLKTWNADNDGKLRIIPKAEIKAIIGRSPDHRDVLMMRAYLDLNPSMKAPKKGRII